MKRLLLAIAITSITGCASNKEIPLTENQKNLWVDTVSSQVALDYPTVEKEQLEVVSGTQSITVANALADRLGVEYIEWSPNLNPYTYKQTRNQLITLDYMNPQRSFLELFANSGLLPLYDNVDRTITIHPYSLQNSDDLNQPFVFTPMFDRSIEERKEVLAMQKERLSKTWLKYHYYKNYTIQETVNAWANQSSIGSVVWYLQDKQEVSFVTSKLAKDDYEIGQKPIEVINKFLKTELKRQNENLRVSAYLEKGTNRLVIHPLISSENIMTFDVEASDVRSNLTRIAKVYGYELEWQATNYKVRTPYVTVLTDFVERSIERTIQQYPLSIEVIESTKVIKIKDGK